MLQLKVNLFGLFVQIPSKGVRTKIKYIPLGLGVLK